MKCCRCPATHANVTKPTPAEVYENPRNGCTDSIGTAVRKPSEYAEKPEKKPDELAGCYVIETDHHELSAEEIYRIYTSLTKVEDSFRSLKTDLGIRPVYHQLEKRTKGHLFISVLAYYLLSAIEARLEKNGNHSRFSSIKETLSTHQRATVRVTTEDDVVYSIRSSGTPEPKHKEIYQTLGVKDPLRKIKRPAVHL